MEGKGYLLYSESPLLMQAILEMYISCSELTAASQLFSHLCDLNIVNHIVCTVALNACSRLCKEEVVSFAFNGMLLVLCYSW